MNHKNTAVGIPLIGPDPRESQLENAIKNMEQIYGKLLEKSEIEKNINSIFNLDLDSKYAIKAKYLYDVSWAIIDPDDLVYIENDTLFKSLCHDGAEQFIRIKAIELLDHFTNDLSRGVKNPDLAVCAQKMEFERDKVIEYFLNRKQKSLKLASTAFEGWFSNPEALKRLVRRVSL